MSTRTAFFDADGDWTCPDGVTAVLATMVPGGGGATGAGDLFNFNGASGGAGGGELMLGRPTAVIPGNTYSVVVGNRGIGAAYAVVPGNGTSSQFNGLIVLPGHGNHDIGPGNSGAGGGVGGSPGGFSGAGFVSRGSREACHFTGGSGGSYASFYNGFHAAVGTVHGGQLGFTGVDVGGGGSFGHSAGGAGGGSIWGSNTGGNSRTTPPDGASDRYGSGAGGAGEPESGTNTGGDGSPGMVMLMWVDGRV